MMIKAILFDLDGVLVDADGWHFNALNEALEQSGCDGITWRDHLQYFKGLPTREKLGILQARHEKNLGDLNSILALKQRRTIEIIKRRCQPDPSTVEMLRELGRRFKIGVCSNANRESVQLMLALAGLDEFCDLVLSKEDVRRSKPAPDIYHLAFALLDIDPEEALIVEDSAIGLSAARASGAAVCPVAGPEEVNFFRVTKGVRAAERINIVVPAAGQGRRFQEAGYAFPKPMILVNGKPMIEMVLDNIRHVGRPIVLMQREHIEKYCADFHLRAADPAAELVPVDGLTDGATSTVLLAREYFDNSNELIIANSDQYLDFDLREFVSDMRCRKADAGMLTFEAADKKWSYAKLNAQGLVEWVAEKKVISNQATVGIYYFRRGSEFTYYARQMIAKDLRVNGEFYVSQVFNEYLVDSKRVLTFEIGAEQMHGLGTPEDLALFLKRRQRTSALELETEILDLDSMEDGELESDTLRVPAKY